MDDKPESKGQGLLFPAKESGGPSAEEFPEDVARALKILSGQVDFGQGMEPDVSGVPGNSSISSNTLRDRFERGMLKNHESKNAIPVRHGYKVSVLDIASEEGARALEEALEMVSSDPSYQISMTAEKTVLDRSSKRGFRVIVTVTTWKVKMAMPPGKTPPTFEKPADRPPAAPAPDRPTS